MAQPRPVGGPSDPRGAPAAVMLADAVRDRFLLRTGFPLALGPISGLSDPAARSLLADLVAAALRSLGRGDSHERRAKRIGAVVAALTAEGRLRAALLPEVVAAALTEADPHDARRLVELIGLVGPTELMLEIGRVIGGPWSPHRRGPSRAVQGETAVLVQHSPWPGMPSATAAPEPTRPAYALLDAPDRVPPGSTFELRVGLAEAPESDVVQTPFAVPVGAFTLAVQVVAPGFRLLGGSSWERTIAVAPDDPHPYEVLRLVALDGFARARSVMAEYAVDGRTLGYATRVVEVAAADAEEAPQAQPTTPAEPGGVWVLPAAGADRPDLEIVVARGNDVDGTRLSWLCRTKHAGVTVPSGPVESVLDGSAEFARQSIAGIEQRVAQPDLPEYLADVSRQVGHAVPEEIWAALADAARQAGGPPTVLLATWEPYMPWELAEVPAAWDDTAPAILGAQAVIGRWTYSDTLRTAGPPTTVTVGRMAVVTGDYAGALELPEAEAEADTLRQRYGAATVDATVRPILDCIQGAPRSDALHFALHGRSSESGTNDGFLMRDRTYLSPISVRGSARKLKRAPSQIRLAFLNACQVGQGRRLLGEYTGMAPAFLGVGTGAVVAPLWQVDDVVAREVAEAFWAAVLPTTGEPGIPPAERFRRERAALGDDWAGPNGTRLAYLFFGHPCLRVVRETHDIGEGP